MGRRGEKGRRGGVPSILLFSHCHRFFSDGELGPFFPSALSEKYCRQQNCDGPKQLIKDCSHSSGFAKN